MRLLITRPKDDASVFATLIAARGHEPVAAPLMELHIHEGPPLKLDGMQAVIATSANGVRALAARSEKRDIALYAVGPQTAEAAKAAGFTPVRSAESDAAALVELIAAELHPKRGTLLHAAGAETAGRLHQGLQGHGFTVETVALYEAVAATVLPAAADQALRAGTLGGVVLFSPRSAKILADLIAAAGLADSCARLQAFCISAATAAALGTLIFARVCVAGAPNQDAMLALFDLPEPGPVKA